MTKEQHTHTWAIGDIDLDQDDLPITHTLVCDCGEVMAY